MLSENSRELMQLLLKAAEEFVESNTKTRLPGITEEMCNRAINAIKHMKDACENQNLLMFNQYLIKLYSAIPRIAVNSCFLEHDVDNLIKRYEWEAMFVDNINGARNAILNKTKTSSITEEEKLLQERGLSVEDVSSQEISLIKSLMGKDSGKFIKAWKVKNFERDSAFESYCQKNHISNRRLMWHGSETCNFLSIFSNGLSFSKARFGMFGRGFYFAPPPFFGKSRGYTSVSNSYWRHGDQAFALVALFDVAVGRSYDVYQYGNQKDAAGLDSLWAHSGTGNGLVHDEVVVYSEDAMSIRYIVKTK